LLVVIVLGGYLVVRNGAAQMASVSPPMLAAAMRIAPDDAQVRTALAKAELSRAAAAQQAQGQAARSLLPGNSPLLQRAGKEAEAALASNVVDVEAMAILGLATDARGDRRAAAAIMHASDSLSRRNVATRLWLIEDAARRQQLPEMLRHIDIALRVSANAQDTMFPFLARALAEPSLVPDFTRILKREPNWTEPFLYTAITTGYGTRNLARIYLALGKPYKHDGQDLSELIMQTLIAQRDYASAFAFDQGLTAAAAVGTQVEDPAFVQHRGLEPFTWRLTATADFDAARSTDPFGNTGLAVTSSGSGADVVAAQLLALRPGRYRFANGVTSDLAELSLVPEWRLRCAEDDRIFGTFRPLTQKQAEWTVPDDCRYQWLELYIDASATLTGESMFVKPISLAPVAAPE
jgi:hypothetical protein